MSGNDAVRELLEAAKREDVLALELVARALTKSRKKVLRDWKSRNLPITQVGRDTLLPAMMVLRVYFRHHLPSTTDEILVP